MSQPSGSCVGSDSAGFDYKDAIPADLQADDRVAVVDDLGVHAGRPGGASYPSVAIAAATKIAAGEADRAILFCGTGIGVAIAANKVPGIRATVAHDSFSVERSILSNDCQVLTMGQRVIGLAARPAAGQGVAGLRLRPHVAVQRQGRGDHRVRAGPRPGRRNPAFFAVFLDAGPDGRPSAVPRPSRRPVRRRARRCAGRPAGPRPGPRTRCRRTSGPGCPAGGGPGRRQRHHATAGHIDGGHLSGVGRAPADPDRPHRLVGHQRAGPSWSMSRAVSGTHLGDDEVALPPRLAHLGRLADADEGRRGRGRPRPWP